MTASRHLVLRAADARFLGPPQWAPSAVGARRWAAVDDQAGAHVGAVHTGFGICELEPGGSLPGHVHSFEQSFFILQGEVVLTTAEGSFLAQRGRLDRAVGRHAGAAAAPTLPR